MKLTTTIGCLLLTISTFAQKSYVLKQNYPVGKKYDFNLASDQIIKQKIDGNDVNLTQNIGTDYTFDIAAGKDGDKNVKVTYNRIMMKSFAAGNTLIVDSDQKSTEKPSAFGGFKGASFNLVFGSNGSIKSVSGLQEMIDKMASKLSTDTSQVKLVKESLRKQFSEEGMKQAMESAFKIYPDKPIKVGESWSVNSKMQMTMPIETSATYTLKEVKNGIATVIVKGILVSKGSFETMGNKLETDLTGTNEGDIQLDLVTGLVLNSYLRIEIFGKMKTNTQDIDFNMEGINRITGKISDLQN